jgi:hypothetical protein
VGAGVGRMAPALNQVSRAMVSSAVAQAIGVAVGAQDKFSWAGVAAAGAGAWAGGQFENDIASSTASLLADAATRSLIEGTDFGDNVMAALPSVIGSIVGDMMAMSSAADEDEEFSTPPDAAPAKLASEAELQAQGYARHVEEITFRDDGSAFLRTGGARIVEGRVVMDPPHESGVGIILTHDAGADAHGQTLYVVGEVPINGEGAARVFLANRDGEAFHLYRSGRIETWGVTVGYGADPYNASATMAAVRAHRDSTRFAMTVPVEQAVAAPTRPVSFNQVANTFRAAAADAQAAIGRWFDNAINGPLVSQRQINHWASLPYRETVATPTLGEFYWDALHYAPFIGPVIGAVEHNNNVITALSHGDEAGAVSEAQAAMFDAANAVLQAPAALGVTRAVVAETAAGMPQVRVSMLSARELNLQSNAIYSAPPLRARVLPSSNSQMAFVESLASRANAWARRTGITGTPQDVGIKKHGYAAALLERYNRIYRNPRNLAPEVQYLAGRVIAPGKPRYAGSVVVDVVEGPIGSPTRIYDYKFGVSTWGPSRVAQISRVTGVTSRSIYEVRP